MEWLTARDPTSAWTHFAWMILAVPGTLWLLWLSRHHRFKQLGMLIFGLSLIFCMAGSFLYHKVPEAISDPYNILDHSGIYTLIAGTVTAIAIVGLHGWLRLGLLILIWVLAAIGILLRIFAEPPLAVRSGFYLFMGWVGIVLYFQLARTLSHRTVSLIWIGGLFYSLGAIINVCHWPTIDPVWFDAHDLFHVFVMAGSLAHYLFMVLVLTHPREARAAAVSRQRETNNGVGRTANPAQSLPA